MTKKCVICNADISEEYGKLNGTLVKAVDENKRKNFIPVCCECQRKDGWIEKAKIKGA
jgi:hypothetical protein